MVQSQEVSDVIVRDLETGKTFRLDGVKSITEEVKSKEPARTYIQMYMSDNKKRLSELSARDWFYMALECCSWLVGHPEQIEVLVKNRVSFKKRYFSNKHIHEWEWLFLEMQIVKTWIYAERTFSINFVSLDEIEEFREEHKEKPNPIYIPKHIARRRKW